MIRSNSIVAIILCTATPVGAQTAFYDMYLEGPTRDTLVLKVDTRELLANPVIQPAPFTAVVERADGTKNKAAYSIRAVRSGKVYEWRKRHGIVGARSVVATNLAWAARPEGGKADGVGSLMTTKPTDIILVDTMVSPPPITGAVLRCNGYSLAAVRQFRDADRRQCGFTGARWSPQFRYHYLWCVGVTPQASGEETTARGRLLATCARR